MNINFELFKTFFKIGIFTLGGGYAMIPVIQTEIVNNKKWIDLKEFQEIIALDSIIPGSVSVNISSIIGHKLGGITGLLFAVAGLILPAFIIIILFYKLLLKYKNKSYVKGIIYSLRLATISLIVLALLVVLEGKKSYNFIDITIILGIIFVVKYLNVSPILAIIASTLIGGLFFS